MSSTIDMLRTNVMAAIRSLVPADVEVLEGRVPATAFALAIRTPAVVVFYGGKPKKEDGPIGRRDRQGYSYVFTIAIVEANWATPQGAAYEAANLAEIIHGSPTSPDGTPNLRTIDLGVIHEDHVRLRFVSEAPEIDAGSTAQGGKFALVQTWQTEEVRC
jgi:hypothetical protein